MDFSGRGQVYLSWCNVTLGLLPTATTPAPKSKEETPSRHNVGVLNFREKASTSLSTLILYLLLLTWPGGYIGQSFTGTECNPFSFMYLFQALVSTIRIRLRILEFQIPLNSFHFNAIKTDSALTVTNQT